MFNSFEGLLTANQYLTSGTSHLVLSHASFVDTLVLAEHDSTPYEYYPTGWTIANGRSLLGGIRLNGNNWTKDRWECNFHVTKSQYTLFNQLLQLQQTSTAVILNDYWDGNVPVTKNVWINTDAKYLTQYATRLWYRLQFQLWEV